MSELFAFLTGFGTAIGKWIGRACKGPKRWTRAIEIATLSVVDTLLTACNAGVISDVRRLKEARLTEIEAEADGVKADAQKKLAEATDAANRATQRKRANKLADAKIRQENAKAEKDEAEAAKSRAETEKLRAEATKIDRESETKLIEAEARFFEALSKLRQEGGDLFVSQKNLRAVRRSIRSPRKLQQLGNDPAKPPEGDADSAKP